MFFLLVFSLFLLTNRVNLQVVFSGALVLLALRVEIWCNIARDFRRRPVCLLWRGGRIDLGVMRLRCLV